MAGPCTDADHDAIKADLRRLFIETELGPPVHVDGVLVGRQVLCLHCGSHLWLPTAEGQRMQAEEKERADGQ